MGGFAKYHIGTTGQAPTANAEIIALLVIFPTACTEAKTGKAG
jgi:hypothetical protein